MSDRKRELSDLREPPKFMKPGDNPELDHALNRLRYDSDIYAPGQYDVFGRRRNMGKLGAQQPEEAHQPQSEDGTPESAEPKVAPEHVEPAAPPVASTAPEPKSAPRPRRTRLVIAVLAGCAVLGVLVLLRPGVDQGPPPQSSATAPPSAAISAPPASATTRATSSPVPDRAPQIPSSAPTTSAAVQPPPAPIHAPPGKRRPRDTTDDRSDAGTPPLPVTAAPVAPPPPPVPPPPPPTKILPPELTN